MTDHDREFWLEIRRGCITVARAIAKRWPAWQGLLILFAADQKING